MSTLKVEVVTIDAIEKHPNADRLDLAVVKDWRCVTAKDRFQVGDKAVYFPIDSVLPPKLEASLFPPDSKIKLEKSRIRTIKIRGAISQGLLCTLDELGLRANLEIGTDLTAKLDVTKYEPPVHMTPQSRAHQVSRKQVNPHFNKYTDIENFKNYPELFQPEDKVVVLEKIHGTNFRAGYVPFHASTFWKKVKRFFGLTPKFEFVYGSHNVQLQDKFRYNGYHSENGNVYDEAVKKYRLREVVCHGDVIYGEIYGDGIQKNYSYGCGDGERKLAVFDIKRDGQYLDQDSVDYLCAFYGLPHAPIEYIGPFMSREFVRQFVDGPSTLCDKQKVREGVIIKSASEQMTYMGRKILKFKSDEFLLKTDDDTH